MPLCPALPPAARVVPRLPRRPRPPHQPQNLFVHLLPLPCLTPQQGLTTAEMAAAITQLNDTLFGETADFAATAGPNFKTFFGNLGAYDGTADINTGWVLLSGYLVFFMQVQFKKIFEFF